MWMVLLRLLTATVHVIFVRLTYYASLYVAWLSAVIGRPHICRQKLLHRVRNAAEFVGCLYWPWGSRHLESHFPWHVYYPRWCGLRLVRQCLISALFRNLKSRTFTAEFWSSLCSQRSLFFKLHVKLMRKVFYPKIYRHTLYNWKHSANRPFLVYKRTDLGSNK